MRAALLSKKNTPTESGRERERAGESENERERAGKRESESSKNPNVRNIMKTLPNGNRKENSDENERANEEHANPGKHKEIRRKPFK